MKAVIFSVLALGSMALATEGLATSPQKPFMTIRMGGGMNPYNYHNELYVFMNGQVVDTRSKGDEVLERKVVLKLSPEVVAGLEKQANEIKAEELTDSQPEHPGCYDAPSTTYSVIQRGKEVRIGARSACKDFVHSDAVAQQLTSILKSFDLLSNYSANN